MAQIEEESGYTNHSLRVTTVNTLIEQGFNESDIMQITGHRSATTVAGYRRNTNVDIISNALASAATAASASAADIDEVERDLTQSVSQECRDAIAECYEDLVTDEDFNQGDCMTAAKETQTSFTIMPEFNLFVTCCTRSID